MARGGGARDAPMVPLDGSVCPQSWREALGTVAGIEVEVGCGRGVFLIEEARRRPSCGFVGIEVSSRWARVAARAVASAGLRNAVVVRAEALEFFRSHVDDESIDAVHVYFPDPWPRPRHQKRRVWRPDFVDEVLRILRRDGRIITATDIRGYFVTIQGLLRSRPGLVERAVPLAWPMTAYARKFLERGRPVFGTVFVKVMASATERMGVTGGERDADATGERSRMPTAEDCGEELRASVS